MYRRMKQKVANANDERLEEEQNGRMMIFKNPMPDLFIYLPKA